MRERSKDVLRSAAEFCIKLCGRKTSLRSKIGQNRLNSALLVQTVSVREKAKFSVFEPILLQKLFRLFE